MRFVCAVANVDVDLLRLEQGGDHRAQGWQYPIVGIRKADPFAPRPGEPGGRVWFPFRRHTITERGRFGFVRHRAARFNRMSALTIAGRAEPPPCRRFAL